MKPNRTRSIAKSNMRRFGQKKYRSEQILAANLIQAHLPAWANVDTEEMIEVYDPDNPLIRKNVSVDITVRFEFTKVAIELNGPIHDELPQKRRDARKQIILEWNKFNYWKYLPFDYNKMPTLWIRNRRNLSYDEAVKAYGEILIAIGDILPLQDASKSAIEEVLRKTSLN